MSTADWVVLLLTLLLMMAYGLYKGRRQDGARSYLLADRQMPWYMVLLGIMATQASAITFLSAPGQAYTDGMRFVQYYFGLPLAMIVISTTFIPIFRKLNVYTAYEYLEQRFDRKTRKLTSLLFLVSRGLSTGISIYTPAIILSSLLGINIYLSNIITGGLLIIYTCVGGAKAVAHTQKLQFLIILSGMSLAGFTVVYRLPAGVSAGDALFLAGKAGKLNVINTGFSWHDKYNIWSGVIGGFFLALSYFGTDQSQVGRYITAKDDRNGKAGLLLNGLVKIPMQFLILLLGTLLFAFYSYYPAPVNFDVAAYNKLMDREPQKAARINAQYAMLERESRQQSQLITYYRHAGDSLNAEKSATAYEQTQRDIAGLRAEVARELNDGHYTDDKNDSNYIFLYFVKYALPKGIAGLLFAVIILASWGSISAALNALAASSMVDIQLPGKTPLSERQQVATGRIHTLAWGTFCIAIAMFAARLGSLIEAVNVLGSLFYGAILGVFLIAFYVRRVRGNAVFYASVLTELAVIAIYCLNIVSFLWLNVAGALLVVILSVIIETLWPENTIAAT